jgi:hypothetical protein
MLIGQQLKGDMKERMETCWLDMRDTALPGVCRMRLASEN